MKVLSCYGWSNNQGWGFWIRVFGVGLVVSTMQPMFSERYGYKRIHKIGRIKLKFIGFDRLA